MKLIKADEADDQEVMPPTRGHDLKLLKRKHGAAVSRCPPHGGTT